MNTGSTTTLPAGSRTHAGLASALRIAVMRLARRLRNERTDESLSPTHVATLATLERHGPMTPGELAAHERVQPPSMTRIAAALEEAGFLDRTDHPTDGRQVLLTVTRAGLDLLAADRRRREAWLAQRLLTLSPEDRATLRSAAEILDHLAST